MGKQTPMDEGASRRVQSAADRRPESDTARSGFKERAQSSADRRQDDDGQDDDEDEGDAAGFRGSGSPAGGQLLEVGPWAWAFASMAGLPVLVASEWAGVIAVRTTGSSSR